MAQCREYCQKFIKFNKIAFTSLGGFVIIPGTEQRVETRAKNI
jgi:hypothetical protein